MSSSASGEAATVKHVPGGVLYKKDFWLDENQKYIRPHYRMEKAARIINRLAGPRECNLLDVGCGPATLQSLLRPNVHYHGIDIAIQAPAPNLVEADFIEAPIGFRESRFDIVLAQGVFEYMGTHQDEKFAEIAALMEVDGTFVVSYVNFDHRKTDIYWPYSNVQPFADFRRSLASHFTIRRCFPTSYNWGHWEPSRRFVRTANMHLNLRLPLVSRALAVEYLLICSARTPGLARRRP